MAALVRTCPTRLNGKTSRARILHSVTGNSQGSTPPHQTIGGHHVYTERKASAGTVCLGGYRALTHCVQILQEIGQKKAFAEQQLLIVRQQKVANTRESRMLQLTASEMELLPKETKVYEGVGKMHVIVCLR
jgi:hypothetical protein